MTKEIDDVVPITINILEFEDFTIYEIVDPDGNMTITANSVAVDHMERPIEAYVRKDFGDDFFTDFIHELDIMVTAGSDRGHNILWGVTSLETVHTENDWRTGSDGISLYLWYNYGNMWLYFRDSITRAVAGWTPTEGILYHLVISRQGEVGTVEIYEGDTLLHTINITLSTQPYRYLFATASRGAGGEPNSWLSYIVSNLRIL